MIAKYFKDWRLLATDLGLDFDVLVNEAGSGHERSRCIGRRVDRSQSTPTPVCDRSRWLDLVAC
jgi:hypothetical protein